MELCWYFLSTRVIVSKLQNELEAVYTYTCLMFLRRTIYNELMPSLMMNQSRGAERPETGLYE